MARQCSAVDLSLEITIKFEDFWGRGRWCLGALCLDMSAVMFFSHDEFAILNSLNNCLKFLGNLSSRLSLINSTPPGFRRFTNHHPRFSQLTLAAR